MSNGKCPDTVSAIVDESDVAVVESNEFCDEIREAYGISHCR